jgi:hypothetical protein
MPLQHSRMVCYRVISTFWLTLILSVGLSPGLHAAGNEKAKSPIPGAESSNYGLQYERSILTGVGLEDVFQYNSMMTTDFGPAYANIFTIDVDPITGNTISNPNFLQCNPPSSGLFSYALCYYSGPDFPTGLSADNPALPCELSPDGKIANCTCYELSTDTLPSVVPYFVDINAISNLAVYNETVEVCSTDGSLCEPTGKKVAPVCNVINANALVPGADLISVFSPVKTLDYFAGSTICHDDGAYYAGCMTSPCYRTGEQDADGNDLVECRCPVYEGPFEIGQGAQAGNTMLDCQPPGNHVWSAAHNPDAGKQILPVRPDGRCFPDAPPEKGCDLFSAGTGSDIQPGSPICQQVCEAYDNGFANLGSDVQAGYSCDATLCTVLGLGQDLPLSPLATNAARVELTGLACEGLENIGNAGLEAIALVEELAQCSCCASQICGCQPNAQTAQEIDYLNDQQRGIEIKPQCDINQTLCGTQ